MAISKVINPLVDLDQWLFGDAKGSHVLAGSWIPRADLSEDDSNYYVELEIPGIGKDDLKLEIKGRSMSISGEKKTSEEVESKKLHSQERSYGSFVRYFHLPEDADLSKIDANHEDGVLRVVIAKTEQAKPQLVKIN